MIEHDKFIMLQILNMTLSVSAVEQLRFYTDNQKFYSRKIVGHSSSAIHGINNGSSEILLSSSARNALLAMDSTGTKRREH